MPIVIAGLARIEHQAGIAVTTTGERAEFHHAETGIGVLVQHLGVVDSAEAAKGGTIHRRLLPRLRGGAEVAGRRIGSAILAAFLLVDGRGVEGGEGERGVAVAAGLVSYIGKRKAAVGVVAGFVPAIAVKAALRLSRDAQVGLVGHRGAGGGHAVLALVAHQPLAREGIILPRIRCRPRCWCR